MGVSGPPSLFIIMMRALISFAIALGALLCPSCKKDMNEAQTFTCVISNGTDTRLGIDAQGKTRWEAGDQILVHGAGSSNRKTITLKASDISSDGKTATITVSGVTPYDRSSDKGYISTYYASYPASAVSSGNLYYYGRFNDTNVPLMSAYDNTKGQFIFYNLCGLITFSVSGDYDSYEFCGNNGETVGYSFYQTYLVLQKDGTPRLDFNYVSDNGTKDPLTIIKGNVTADGSTSNRICLPNGASFSKGFTIKFLKGGKVVKVAKSDSSVSIGRNKLLALGDISVRLTDPSELPDPEEGTLCKPEYLGKTPMICCYFTEYTSSSVFPTLEDVKCFTHINVGHARFVNPQTGDGGLVIKSPGPNYIKKLAAYKKDYPELKLLLFIGGWGKNADGFSEMAKDDAKRALFCSECVRLCNEYGLDGVDLDWEYPTYAAKTTLSDGSYYYNGADKADRANFTKLVKELRAALGVKKIISFAAASDDYSSAEYIDYNGVLEWVDYINVMTYSMGDPNPSNPSKQKHNSPLYKSSRFANNRGGADCIEGYHNKQGVPYNRMNYGIGFYGHGDGSVYPSSVSYTIAREALEKGTASGKSVVGYNIRWWDDASKSCYLGNADGTMYASYEDAESIGYRVAYLKSKGMLGCLIWEYREDDSSGTLRKALYQKMTAE